MNHDRQADESPARPTPTDRAAAVAREIRATRDSAGSALEVYRQALARVTSLVEADFASVFLRDPDDPRALRLACAQNWPQSSARFLDRVRIREGSGPSGLALEEVRPVEVPDVFDDAELEDWWEPARELGFTAMVAQPLVIEDRPVGVVSFYFHNADPMNDARRELLQTAAREMAAAARAVEAG